uniref:Uncharacterized protein LOC100185420 n=1 Tax=Phallusia mammillata TaxID=59560 RepID=A0A6F9DIX1_9ASCI|nr:uncharacterized protein LOC100185420 [Phallusia mammillata]
MAKTVQIVVIFVAVLAVLLAIAAVATDEWIKACINMSSLMKAAGSAGQASGISPGMIDQFGQMTMCLTMGVITVGMNVANLVKTSVTMSFAEKDATFHVTSALVVVGIILLIIGIVLFSMATCNQSHSGKSQAYSRSRNGSCLIIVGGVVFLIAMVVFSGSQASTIHKPIQFLGLWGMGMAGGLKNGFPGLSGSGGAGGNPFESMFNDFGSSMGGGSVNGANTAGDNTNGGNMNEDNTGGLDFNSMFNDTSNSMGGFDLGSLGNFNNGGNRRKRQMPDMGMSGPDAANILAIFQTMDPVFGYSYYLGWVAVALAFMSGILGIVFHSRSRHGDTFDRVPLA